MHKHLLSAMLVLPLTAMADDTPQYFERCLQNVLDQRPGNVLKVELKEESENQLYEFNVRGIDGKDWDVECHRQTGEIVEIEQEVAHPNHPLFKQNVKINQKEAKAIALSKIDGEIVEVEYEVEADGGATYEFDIDTLNNGQIKLEIDAASGNIIEINHELWQVGLE